MPYFLEKHQSMQYTLEYGAYFKRKRGLENTVMCMSNWSLSSTDLKHF